MLVESLSKLFRIVVIQDFIRKLLLESILNFVKCPKQTIMMLMMMMMMMMMMMCFLHSKGSQTQGLGTNISFWTFCLSEEISTKVSFAFSNNGLKSEDLQFGMKKSYMISLIMFHDFRFGLGIVTTHLTYHYLKYLFDTKNRIIA